MNRLERSYRRLLRLYPRTYRAGREEEMLGVLLAAAAPGQQRPAAADVADLVAGALRVWSAEVAGTARARPATAAGFVVLVVGLLVSVLPGDPAPAPREPDALPPRFPGYSFLTGEASSSPPGPVVALYQQGSNAEYVDTRQAVVVRASGAHRRIPLDGLLSPDGALVASGEGLGDGSDLPVVTVLDLTSGASEAYPVAGGRFAGPMAWAPDGQHLAVSVARAPANTYATPGETGEVVLLDLETGTTSLVAEAPNHPYGGAFAPDGTQLAVQDVSGEVVVVDLTTGSARSLGRATHWISGDTAWSPDGALLATVHPLDFRADARQCDPFIAVDGGPVPDCIAGEDQWARSFVGWTGPRSVAVLAGELSEDDPAVLLDLDLTTGDTVPLTSIPTSGGDYQVAGMQVPASVLESRAVVEPPTIHRTRWPLVLRLAAAAGAATLVSAVVAATARAVDRRRSTRRGRARLPAAGAPRN